MVNFLGRALMSLFFAVLCLAVAVLIIIVMSEEFGWKLPLEKIWPVFNRLIGVTRADQFFLVLRAISA